jgi:hypothetical protein
MIAGKKIALKRLTFFRLLRRMEKVGQYRIAPSGTPLIQIICEKTDSRVL